MSKKPTRVFWIVRYRLWGADGESYMWFDHKEDAEKFASHTIKYIQKKRAIYKLFGLMLLVF